MVCKSMQRFWEGGEKEREEGRGSTGNLSVG